MLYPTPSPRINVSITKARSLRNTLPFFFRKRADFYIKIIQDMSLIFAMNILAK